MPDQKSAAGALVLIGAVVVGAAAAFATTAGWLSPGRLSPQKFVDTLDAEGGHPVGHRRNHAKGICFTGSFAANGAGTRLSTAPMLAQGQYPVIGRFAIGVPNPAAPDAAGRVHSMAVRIVAPDGQEWRSGMNAMPMFPVRTPEAFYGLLQASAPDPATGKPDPEAMQRFGAAHPEIAAFVQWAQTAPWSTSYSGDSFNSLDAFRFVDAGGARRTVRWTMQAQTPATTAAPGDLPAKGPDFLAADLKQRIGQGPIAWKLVVTMAAADDPSDDPTKVWPPGREQVDVGTLTVSAAQDEADGPCRDFNYDPMILPAGIEPSDDPFLPARSAAYANSFDRRAAEAGQYPHLAKAAP